MIRIAFIALLVFVTWMGGVVLRRRMSKKLGRDVSELEMTSIATNMELLEKEEQQIKASNTQNRR